MRLIPSILFVALFAAGCDAAKSPAARVGADKSPNAVIANPPRPNLPLNLPRPPPESALYGGKDLKTLSADELEYLGHQARMKGNLPAEIQLRHWSVVNGGGSKGNLACAYSLNNQVDAAFYWLQRSALEEGYDAGHAEVDPDLRNVRRDPRWSTVAQFMKQCNEYWGESGSHEEFVIVPRGYSVDQPIPILIGLHGMGTSAKEFNMPIYQDFADELRVAFLLASGDRPIGPASFVWSNDPVRNAKRIDEALQTTADRFNRNGEKVLFGFSQGATAAVEIARRHPDKYAGAISLSPGAQPLPSKSQVMKRSEHARQGYVLTCGDDEHPITIATTRAYAEIVSELGAMVIHKEYPGVRQHSFPADFDEQFPKWVSAILDGR